jgi:DNA-binding LacI/PurR family transcriptional regulator
MAVRMRDVAERAGVSVRTVSYAVNTPDRVASETLARVLAVVNELGYEPNAVARGLRTGRTGLIGLVVPNLDTPYFAEITRELVAALGEHDLTLVVDQTDGDVDRERELLIGGSRAAAFDGLILSPLGMTADDLAHRRRSTPVILLGERILGGGLDHVVVDNVQAAYDATSHLIGSGYRRIAVIGRPPSDAPGTSMLRIRGFERAMTEAGLDPMRYPVTAGPFTRPVGAEAMADLLDRPDPPDAVFCFSDLLALGALRTALIRGVAVPSELGIIGFDDIEDGRFSTPTLTTVRPDKKELAAHTVDLLLRRLAGFDGPPISHVIGHELVHRESTR